MTTTVKMALAAAVTALLCMLALPIAITMMALPGQGTQQFFATCTAALGIRGAIVANPPNDAPSAQEVLLKIDQTAETLGFGRQGATVTVAIAMRATGLANAANAAAADTQRYAHSAVLNDGAGALGLPLSWGSAAELMTPEVSTALALDHMVDTEPRWRDADPSQLAAQITGLTAEDFTQYIADAQARLGALPAPAETSSAPAALTSAAPTTTQQTAEPAPPTTTAATSTATTVLNPDQASSAMSTAPAAANCLHALTTPLPAAAPGPNPAGHDIAAAAQRSVGTDQTATTTRPTNEPIPAQPTTPPTNIADSAEFVASILSSTLGTTIPTTIAEQLQIGYRVVADPEPGDAVYIDISASAGPHLAGIAVDADTMVTVLPGHSAPEWTRIGPNRVIRRIEGGPSV
ncbi:hypothetical protein QRB41_14235 [Mycobacterium avium subsp. hominissuis]|uniref:hypothetical protein n=1 Tax=Mycobacterium avium TaxID=1764 RepID=UPI00049FF901|nr:hypothetical protein [Mycobacterium avium]KDP00407.1 hypothetical protein MAV100_25345 [Mycobacterium avium subsp. hominissuis 100]MBZ4572748.1 hypothetical protein [Mycobacterium avium subsp. hominissuis]MDO2384551.1 hypothetical protein [Mycobacterium avium subsp. hominissuis]